MDHCLIRPLVEKWRHGVFTPIQDQQGGLASLTAATHLLNEVGLLYHLGFDFLGKKLADRRAVIIANSWVSSTCWQQHREKTINHALKARFFNWAPFRLRTQTHGCDCWDVQRKEIWVGCLEVEINLLYLVDYVVAVCLRQALDLLALHFAWEVQVIAGKLWAVTEFLSDQFDVRVWASAEYDSLKVRKLLLWQLV